MRRSAGHPRLEEDLVRDDLKKWDLKQLFSLQEALTREIGERVNNLEEHVKSLGEIQFLMANGKREESQGNVELGRSFPYARKRENVEKIACQEDSGSQSLEDQLPLTQREKKQKVSSSVKSRNSPLRANLAAAIDEYSIPGTLDMQSKEIDFSSPLKPASAHAANCQKSSPIKHHLAVISDSEGELDWSDTEEREPVNPSSIQVKREPQELFNVVHNERMEFQRKLSLNENPFTKKPWIFEDFKANELLAISNKTTPYAAFSKISKFQSAAGAPVLNKKLVLHPDRGFELVTENVPTPTGHASENGVEAEFDNMRQRSRSPPGFGRLDFPNTQENNNDVMKSREILYNKTKDRFLIATRSDISPNKREFVFRNGKLNDIINEGHFEWDAKSLKIFSRARVRS
ncbi:LAME_0F00804g1_1 [Lachancea meyersii CBS 8951]|uniref:LAME_0F00804g1_1 n=1 Tax=Lachancea meyersii CBS 8951 TaxID=1266667 RepID=A0A1G4JPK0_9SACH|nr:LAME_0F00804g1_1 [Lachancea meyersii CBS 8951]